MVLKPTMHQNCKGLTTYINLQKTGVNVSWSSKISPIKKLAILSF